MSDAIDTFEVKGLDALLKALKRPPPICRVGILGGGARKAGDGAGRQAPTNAEVGAAHEFGTSTIPMRSFLRVPISKNLQKEMEASQLFTKETLDRVIREASLVNWLKQVAACAEACVSDAFDTGGDGEWPPWKNPNYSNNANQLLVDTTQLRESISSEVRDNG